MSYQACVDIYNMISNKITAFSDMFRTKPLTLFDSLIDNDYKWIRNPSTFNIDPEFKDLCNKPKKFTDFTKEHLENSIEILSGVIVDEDPEEKTRLQEGIQERINDCELEFNPKINKIHIVHIHGGIPEKKSHNDLVFRTKATIMGFVPLGGYNMILNRGVGQKNLYEKMCYFYQNTGVPPLLIPPKDERLLIDDEKYFYPPSIALKGMLYPNYLVQTDGNRNFGITICHDDGSETLTMAQIKRNLNKWDPFPDHPDIIDFDLKTYINSLKDNDVVYLTSCSEIPTKNIKVDGVLTPQIINEVRRDRIISGIDILLHTQLFGSFIYQGLLIKNEGYAIGWRTDERHERRPDNLGYAVIYKLDVETNTATNAEYGGTINSVQNYSGLRYSFEGQILQELVAYSCLDTIIESKKGRTAALVRRGTNRHGKSEQGSKRYRKKTKNRRKTKRRKTNRRKTNRRKTNRRKTNRRKTKRRKTKKQTQTKRR